ncbi:MAG: DUF4166 domain-containing protein [Pseudomonadota bacterium]
MISLLARAMGDAFFTLPPELQTFHSPDGPSSWAGDVTIETGSTPQARALARMSGFPPRKGTFPFRLTITPEGEDEVWKRDYDGHVLTSRQSLGPKGTIEERLGPLRVGLRPEAQGETLRMEVAALRIGALPTPAVLRGQGGGTEGVDAEGRITFDVESRAPGLGRLIRYSGHLTRV